MNPTLHIPSFKLKNGLSIPVIGFGFGSDRKHPPNQVTFHNSLKLAIKYGYRHIDSAWVHFINPLVREAINNAIVESDNQLSRNDLFVTCKLWNTHHDPEMVKLGLCDSVSNLGVEYLDIFFINSPMGFKSGNDPLPRDENGNILFSDVHYVDTYKAIEEQVKHGSVKNIGLCNFNIHQLRDVLDNCTFLPAVNQIEFHPYFQNEKLVNFCQNNGILVETFLPFGEGDLLQDQVLVSLGKKYNKSASQVCLRWCYQRGVVSLPRSVKLNQIIENAHIFDFALTDEEMKRINGMDKNKRVYQLIEFQKHKFYPFNED